MSSVSMRWRKFCKLNVNNTEADVWISENQRVKVSVGYVDEEEIIESFLSINHFLQKRREWATKLRLATNYEDLYQLYEDLQRRLQAETASAT